MYQGPSRESIHQTILLQEAWLDDHVHWIPDIEPEFSGVEGHIVCDDEELAEAVMARLSQLRELTQLRQPIGDEWLSQIALHNCPCGFTSDEWARWVEYRDQ